MRKESPRVPPALSAWIAELASVWPKLSRPQIKVLAEYSAGMILAEGSGLSRVSFCLAKWLGQSEQTVRERLRDFYCSRQDKSGRQRRELVVEQCFSGLLGWILSLWQGDQLALAMDATSLGERLVVLAISVVYRGSAISVAWNILPANAKGSWKPHWLRLLRLLKDVVPPSMQVIVMADRGLYAKWLFKAIVELHWHPFLRINGQNAEFRPAPTGRYQAVRGLVKIKDQAYVQRGTLFRGPSARIDCTLVGCWTEGYTDPWLIATDLPADEAEPAWYGLRAWIERGFKHAKSGGLRWQNTRMSDPQRSERLWLVMAVSQMWAMRQGSAQVEQRPTPTAAAPMQPKRCKRRATASAQPKRRYPVLSVFLTGLLLTRLLLCAGVVRPGRYGLTPTPWPTGLPTCSAVPQTQPRPP